MQSIRAFIRQALSEGKNDREFPEGIATSLTDQEPDAVDVNDEAASSSMQIADKYLVQNVDLITRDVQRALDERSSFPMFDEPGEIVTNDDEIARAVGTEYLLRKEIFEMSVGELDYPYRTALFIIGHYNGEQNASSIFSNITEETAKAASALWKEIEKINIVAPSREELKEQFYFRKNHRLNEGMLMSAAYSSFKFITSMIASVTEHEVPAVGGKAAGKVTKSLISSLLDNITRKGTLKILKDQKYFDDLVLGLIRGGNAVGGIDVKAIVSKMPSGLGPLAEAVCLKFNEFWTHIDVAQLISKTKNIETLAAPFTTMKEFNVTALGKMGHLDILDISRKTLEYLLEADASKAVTIEDIKHALGEKLTTIIQQGDSSYEIADILQTAITASKTKNSLGKITTMHSNPAIVAILKDPVKLGTIISFTDGLAEFIFEVSNALPAQLFVRRTARFAGRAAIASSTLSVMSLTGAAGLAATWGTFMGFDNFPENVTEDQIDAIFTSAKIRKTASEAMAAASRHPPEILIPKVRKIINLKEADKLLYEILKTPAGYSVSDEDMISCADLYKEALTDVGESTFEDEAMLSQKSQEKEEVDSDAKRGIK